MRGTPLIVGHIHGTITDSEIRISTKQYTSIHPLKSCSYADLRGDSLVFAFDQRRLLLTVIPRRAFVAGCFERAAKLVMQHAVANKVSPADGVVDRRLQAGEFYPIDLPTEGVRFSGSITSRDVLASPLRSQNMKVKWILIGCNRLCDLATYGHVHCSLRQIAFGIRPCALCDLPVYDLAIMGSISQELRLGQIARSSA